MRAIDILGIITIAVFAFCAGWWFGEYNTVSKTKHCEVVQKYATAIDVYRDYTKALEQSVEIPDVPSLNLLRENVTNNELCDLPGKEKKYQVMNVYKSYR